MSKLPKTLKVACAQMHWAKSIDYNLQKSLDFMQAAAADDCRVLLFPEANLTSYYLPYVVKLDQQKVKKAMEKICMVSREYDLWTITGTIQKTYDRFLNLAHVISPQGRIIHEYAKVNMAGRDEVKYCRGGNKLSLFEIDGIICTMVICRDGRHPELYRIPAMAGAQILFHPSCSSDEIDAVCWKRTSGRAQQAVGPNSKIFHCVANTIGQSPDGKQTSSGMSFIREPNGIPLSEAGYYQEEMITAVLEIETADRSYVIDSMNNPPFLKDYWKKMVEEARKRAGLKPE